MCKNVLFVEDDEKLIKYFKDVFSSYNYNVLTAANRVQVLRILRENEVRIIIGDRKNFEANDFELLSEIKKNYPKIIRVLITDVPEDIKMLKVLQKNLANHIIHKSILKKQEFADQVNQIFLIEELLIENNLLTLVNSMEELPTIKSNYDRILKMIEADENLEKISLELERDYAMTAKILHIANSAYYGIRTGSIRQAISFLGLLNIKNLIMTTSVLDILDCTGMTERMSTKMWEHANLSNKLVELIYNKVLEKKLKHTEMSAGLLFDIGKVVLLKNFTPKYLKLNYKVEYHGANYSEMEKEVFNTTHQQISGYLLKWWQFPYPIIETALFHHKPFEEGIINRELVCATHIADYYSCRLLKVKCSNDLDIRTFSLLGLERDKFEDLIKITFNIT